MTEIIIGAYSDKGVKKDNEDSYGVMFPEKSQQLTKGIAIAIADGMSGCQAGKAASETCVKCFLQDYFATPDSWSVKKAASKILLATNSWMFGQGQSLYGSDLGMVSTLSAMIVKSRSVHVFHIGDSRISLLRDEVVENLTTDHRYGKSHYLTRAMGTGTNLEIDYRVIDIRQGDVFILTTDGVHEYVTTAEMRRFIAENPHDLNNAALLIGAQALEKGSTDNVTCQIIKIDTIVGAGQAHYLTSQNRLPFPPPLDPGLVLEGYKIIREVHANARSQVYLAQDISNGNLVAVKTPSVNFNDDARYIEMFHREEWIGRRINCPHILKIIPPGSDRKFLYYVTEYIEGQTLREWINDHPEPNIAKVRDILRQLIQGLRAIHRLDMVHQDLKPENIMIDNAGTVKIIDFGSVKVASMEEGAGADPSRLPDGSVDYTAPEYLLYGGGDKRSDLYSLGVVIYEILTHKLPYGKGFSTLRRVRHLAYIPATQVNPDILPWIDTILKKAVAKDPPERYQYLSEFERDFTEPPSVEGDFTSLLEKNPLLFWRGLSLILAILLIMSLVM